MSRPLDPAFIAAISSQAFTLTYAAEFEFDAPTGTVRYWTGIGEVDLNGHTYTGLGNLANISNTKEDGSLGLNNLTFTLSGVATTNLSLVLEEKCRNRPCRLYSVIFDSAGNVSVMQQMFEGRMDTMSISEDGDASVISITAESYIIDFDRPRLSRWTYNQRKDSTDNGLKYISAASEMVIPWGSKIIHADGRTQ